MKQINETQSFYIRQQDANRVVSHPSHRALNQSQALVAATERLNAPEDG